MKRLIIFTLIILNLAVFSLLGAHYSSLDDIINEHMHSNSQVYPTLAGGVAVLGGAGWVLGNFVPVIPADTIVEPFDVHYVIIEDLSANDIYEIVLYACAAQTEVGRVRVVQSAAMDGTMNIPIQTPVIDANCKIDAKSASASGTDTATISLMYHTY